MLSAGNITHLLYWWWGIRWCPQPLHNGLDSTLLILGLDSCYVDMVLLACGSTTILSTPGSRPSSKWMSSWEHRHRENTLVDCSANLRRSVYQEDWVRGVARERKRGLKRRPSVNMKEVSRGEDRQSPQRVQEKETGCKGESMGEYNSVIRII